MLEIGSPAPAFELESDTGEALSLKIFTGKRVVLFFYPRDNTSGWTVESLEFQERLEAFKKLNTEIVGISKDSLVSHARFRAKHGFTFELLADVETAMLQAYGAWGEKKNYGKLSMGTIRTTVVVGEDGLVQKVYPKVKAKGHAQVVLEDIGG